MLTHVENFLQCFDEIEHLSIRTFAFECYYVNVFFEKTFSTKRVREEDTGLPTPKKQKIQDNEPLFSDSEPPCSPEPFLPELEVLTQ